jgi:hypothetical protein
MAAPYKPGSQARFLVHRTADSEKNIMKVLTRLTARLDSIKKKMDSTATDLGKVQEKVDLAMASIRSVQDDQAHVVRQVQSLSASPSATEDDIIRSAPSLRPTSSTGAGPTQSPPQPSARLLRNLELNISQTHLGQSGSDLRNLEGDRGEAKWHWMPKMDFPMFDGTDIRI